MGSSSRGSSSGFAPRATLSPVPRCTDVLRESAPRLVLLAAPPGFGKTTLLAQWREVDGRAFACVSLDSADNDPVTFWSYIVQAIRHAVPELGAAALSALGSRARMLSMRSSRLFSTTWKQSARELVLVLDDYQEITNRICHDSLNFFLERMPSNVTLALSTRSDPPIPMARLRALDELLELRAVDLSFTEAESAAFLNEILHLDLTTETLGVLHERTEGWPVGVHLAAMSLSQTADRAGFVARFGGASRHIVDYLTEVVLDTLDEKRRQFLLETSVLDAMCGPLCDAATERQGSAEGVGRARACQPLPDPARRLPGVVSLPRVVRGRAPEPTAPERSRARSRRAPAGVRVARPGGPPLRGRASRRCRRRARERDHVGVGRLAPLARGGRRRRDPPPARGTSLGERRGGCATRRRQGLGAERAQSPRRIAGRARVGGVGHDSNGRCPAASRSRLRSP